MAETSTTTDTVTKTTPLAMLAVAQHAADYDLETWRIEAPVPWRPEDGIVICTSADSLSQWLETVVVTDEPTVSSGMTPETANFRSSEYPALLPSPIGEVRITIRAGRQVQPLHLVGAQS